MKNTLLIAFFILLSFSVFAQSEPINPESITVNSNYTLPTDQPDSGQIVIAGPDGSTSWSAIPSVDSILASQVYVDTIGFNVVTANTVQRQLGQIDTALLKARGTEIFGSVYVGINALDNTAFDVSPIVGQISSDEGYYSISEDTVTGEPIDNIAATSTYVYYDSLGVLRQQTTAPTREEWRYKLFIARFASNGTNLLAFEYLYNPSGQYSNSIRDLYEYLTVAGVPFQSGVDINPNANLTFSRSSGTIFEFGGNSYAENPNVIDIAAENPADFFLLLRSSSGGGPVTNVPVTQIDVGGVLTTMTNNRFTAHRLYLFTSGNMTLQYGQTEWVSINDAIAGLQDEAYVVNPSNKNGQFLGWWIVEKNTTNLQTAADARFVRYTIGTQGVSSGGFNVSGTTDNGLITYDNSSSSGIVEPNIRFDGSNLRVYDATTTDYMQMSHDGTDANINFSGTTDLNINSSTTNFAQGLSGQAVVVVTEETISDNERRSFDAQANHNGSSRVSEIGVRTHPGITNAVSYIYLETEDDIGNILWVDNNGDFRISENVSLVGTTLGSLVGDYQTSLTVTDASAAAGDELVSSNSSGVLNNSGLLVSDLANSEGSWTPTSPDITFSSSSGIYIKFGRLVMVTFNIVDGSSSALAYRISGLPFSPSDNIQEVHGEGRSNVGNITFSINVNSGAGDGYIYIYGNSVSSALSYNDLTGAIIGSIFYFTD